MLKKLTIVYEPYPLVGVITRPKSIVDERIVMKKDPIWYPYSRTKGKIVAAAGRFLGARDWRRRLGR